MTFVVLVLFGLGMVLMASGLEGKPVGATFLKVLRGEPIDWTGGKVTAESLTNPPQQKGPPPKKTPPGGVIL